MSNILKSVALLALLTKSVDCSKLEQKSVMSLDEFEMQRPDDDNLVQSEYNTYTQQDSMDLDDEPNQSLATVSAPTSTNTNMAQSSGKEGKKISVQQLGDDYENSENESGTRHYGSISMEEIHKMNHNLKPAGKMQITDDETPEGDQSSAQTNTTQAAESPKEQEKVKPAAVVEQPKQAEKVQPVVVPKELSSNNTQKLFNIPGAPITEGLFGIFRLTTGHEFKAQVSAPSNETATLSQEKQVAHQEVAQQAPKEANQTIIATAQQVKAQKQDELKPKDQNKTRTYPNSPEMIDEKNKLDLDIDLSKENHSETKNTTKAAGINLASTIKTEEKKTEIKQEHQPSAKPNTPVSQAKK